jgi:hypothetical protein
MMTFKQYLMEAKFYEIIHHKPSIDTVKALAKHNLKGMARFVIHTDGSLYAADSYRYIHHDMVHKQADRHIEGYIKHDNGNYYYQAWNGKNSGHAQRHPMLDRFHKHGILNHAFDIHV